MGRARVAVDDPGLVSAIANAAVGEKINVSRVCRELGISRGTFYTKLARFRVEGLDGLAPRSTAAHHQPGALPPVVVEAVLRARKELDDEGRDDGPISIRWRLQDAGVTPLPSQSSIYRILCEHGQITPQPRKKPRTRRRFEYADPNGCWQLDGMEYRLAAGTTVCVLVIIDDHSRFEVGSRAAASENGADAWAALQQAFTEHGLPVTVLSDNGLAFSGKHRGRMVDLERHLAERGIAVIASSPYHPQTCGKNERSHQTLRKWLDKHPPAENLAALQQLLDRYRHMYNHRRHQGINGQTPWQRYHARPKATTTTPTRNRPFGLSGRVNRTVSATGVVAFSSCSIILKRRWAGQKAHVYWHRDRVTIMINNQVARELTLNRAVRYQPLHPRTDCSR